MVAEEAVMKAVRTVSKCLVILLIAVTGSTQESGNREYADRMAQEHRADAPVPNPASETEPSVPVVGEDVTYATVADVPVVGYLARPEGREEPLPGLIVIHEWWGLNDNIRAMARRLAGEGYLALAVDLYGGKTAPDPATARQLMLATNNEPKSAESNILQAYRYLKETAKAPKVASIGWCFGGGWSLQTALLMPDKVDAAVIYYGHVVTDKKRLETLQMPILGIFGELDRGIPVSDVLIFEGTLDHLEKDATIIVYPDADHAFANPSGRNYNRYAAIEAWRETVNFLAAHLSGKP
jgi:carboxymethylenebutenolidase